MKYAVPSLAVAIAATACAEPHTVVVTRVPPESAAIKGATPTMGPKRIEIPAKLKQQAPPSEPQAPTVPPPSPNTVRDLRRTRGHVSAWVGVASGYASLLSSMPPTSPDRPRWMRDAAEAHVQIERALAPDPAYAHAAASARRDAIRHYQMLLNDHPHWCAAPNTPDPGCADETLYHLALEQERDGDIAAARTSYALVLRDWSRSPYVPSAHLALGEFFLAESDTDRSKLRLAAQSYLSAIKFPPPGNAVYGYAQLQLGQVHLRTGARDAAAKALQAAMAWAAAYPMAVGGSVIAEAAKKALEDLGAP